MSSKKPSSSCPPESQGTLAGSDVPENDLVDLVLRAVPDPLLVLHPDLRVKSSNDAFNHLFQVSGAQVENRFLHEIGDGPWNLPNLSQGLVELLVQDSPIRDFEAEHCFPGLGRRTILLNAHRLEHPPDVKPLILVSFHDITEKKQAEEVNRWMAAIVESSDDAIISKDLNGIIRSVNNGAVNLYGYKIEELLGKPMTTLIPLELQSEETEILARIRRGERIEHFETSRRRKDGSLVEVSLTISPVKGPRGTIIGASKIARDITERKRIEKQMAESFQREREARQQAEMANRAKDDFLASLSHELRTPLNPVLLVASDAAENFDLPPAIRESFEMIRKNIELEAHLIDDLLDLTRITHGKLHLQERVLDAHRILHEAISKIQFSLNEKRIELILNWKAAQVQIAGDEVRLQQVFWNVLKNAVKFTPPHGTITIESSVAQGCWHVRITDTGIGITPEEMPRIFGDFAQGDRVGDKSQQFGGLGLGLAISQRLVGLHSGRILASSPGRDKGATFVIELPLARRNGAHTVSAPEATATTTEDAVSQNCRILLVEDHEATRNALAHLLRRRNYQVVSAGSAAEARAICAREKIDYVISDIGLPDGNGNELMRELQSRFRLKGIALTGYGMEHDIEHSLASGFVSHLIKPVAARTLETALACLIASK